MKQIFITIFIFLITSCSNGRERRAKIESHSHINSNEQNQIVINPETNRSICLSDIRFKQYPTILKVTSAHFYVGDGSYIYQFNSAGKFLKKIETPAIVVTPYIDFAIGNDENYVYITWNGNLTCFEMEGKVKYSVKGGNIVKVDDKGRAFTNYQKYENESGMVLNKLRVIQSDGSYSDYSFDRDLPLLNFEIIDSNIAFHTSDKNFYLLPTSQNSEVNIYSLAELGSDRVWFLGKVGNYYVFRLFNFDVKKDVIHFYNNSLRKEQSELLDVSFGNLIKEQRMNDDFLMDNPSATIYSYYKGKIYYLRNTVDGSCITQLSLP